jgi:hypothetical protein
MTIAIVSVMEVDVIAKNSAANWMVRHPIVYQRLPKRHDQMRSDGRHEELRKSQNERRYHLEHDRILRLKYPI